MHTVLVVDDERAVAEAHARLLAEVGFRALTECDPEQVEAALERQAEIELLLLDLRMPRVNGLELLHRVKLRRAQVGVVMATVVSDIEFAVQAIKSGAYNYLLKPLDAERLHLVLASYFSNQPRSLAPDPHFAAFITGDRAFEPLFAAVRSFAEADVPVLIQGETGTGKELIAEISHALSPRRAERFLPVNVAAISPALFESELFGHRLGAFTGATREHTGYFEEAGHGTLLLDEIGELGNEEQKKLLRVLQNRRYCRVGETQERELHARVLLATNCDLRAAVQEGRFRSDLYFRLAAHSVSLPPLRARTGDIALLADYFLRKYVSQFGRAVAGFHPDTLRLLEAYSFPGNVRELEGIVSGAVLIERNPRVMPAAIPRHIQVADYETGHDAETVRLRMIQATLADCGGNQTLAAKRLGIARETLNRMLKRLRGRGGDAGGDGHRGHRGH